MEFLVRLLDDPTPAPCGHCVNCTGRGLPRTIDDELVRAAVSFLRRDLRTIQPRVQWPADAVDGLSGKITPPNEPGMALCVYGDAGWGRDVQRGKYVDGRFVAELVDGVGQGDPRPLASRSPPPEWVTAVPSTRGARPGRRVRAIAGRSARPTLRRRASPSSRAPNRRRRCRTAPSSSATRTPSSASMAPPCCPGPVLLVDDIVDSRWTLTVAGWLLQTHGSGEVHPVRARRGLSAGRLTDDRRRLARPRCPGDHPALLECRGAVGLGATVRAGRVGRRWRIGSDRQSFRGPRDLVGLAPDEIARSIDVDADEADRIARPARSCRPAGVRARSSPVARDLGRHDRR